MKYLKSYNNTLMKILLTALLSVTLASKVFSFTVHTSYEASSDYALGDIVPSTDANVLFYQAKAALTKNTHQLSNTDQITAFSVESKVSAELSEGKR